MNSKELNEKFETLFKTTIIPKLSPLENHRKNELKKTKSFINIFLPFKKQSVINNYKKYTKDSLFKIMVSIFAKTREDSDMVDMDEIRGLGFCANANYAEYGSILSAVYKSNKIVFTEANIKRQSQDKEDKTSFAMFNGLIAKIETNKNLNLKLILSRHAKDFSTNERKNVYLGSKVNFRFNNNIGLDTLKVEDSKISKLYEILTDDEVKTKKILTDKLTQRILNVRDSFKSAGISIAVFDSDIYIFVEQDDFIFDNLDINKELSDKEEFRKAFIKFFCLFNLINYFNF